MQIKKITPELFVFCLAAILTIVFLSMSIFWFTRQLPEINELHYEVYTQFSDEYKLYQLGLLSEDWEADKAVNTIRLIEIFSQINAEELAEYRSIMLKRTGSLLGLFCFGFLGLTWGMLFRKELKETIIFNKEKK